MGGGSGGVRGASSTSSNSLTRKSSSGSRLKDFVRGLTGSGKDEGGEEPVAEGGVEAIEAQGEGLKKVLYTANVGDARAVLW